MFFAGLIGTYIVLRFGAPVWPHDARSASQRADRRVQHVRADLLQRHDRAGAWKRLGRTRRAWPRCWMLLTLLLGSVFLGVKMYEYNAKFAHGIYPRMPHSRIYEKADLYYASAVRERLNDRKPTCTTADRRKRDRRRRSRTMASASRTELDDASSIEARPLLVNRPRRGRPRRRTARPTQADKIDPLPVARRS